VPPDPLTARIARLEDVPDTLREMRERMESMAGDVATINASFGELKRVWTDQIEVLFESRNELDKRVRTVELNYVTKSDLEKAEKRIEERISLGTEQLKEHATKIDKIGARLTLMLGGLMLLGFLIQIGIEVWKGAAK
jgi:hypothetical protein